MVRSRLLSPRHRPEHDRDRTFSALSALPDMILVDATHGKTISDVSVPVEFYWVLTTPAALARMKYPRAGFPWSGIAAAGFSHVVSLHPGSYDPDPLSQLCAVSLEDLVHGGPPANEDREVREIRKAATVNALRRGEGVVVHCCGGRGRTGTVLGCVLREFGYAADGIVEWLDQVHRRRSKSGWPESDWQAGLVRRWPGDVVPQGGRHGRE